MRSLREVGVRGLVPGPDAAFEDLEAIIRDIGELPRQEKRKESKDVPFLPTPGAHPRPADEGEDGDDDDDGE
jgi:hypothetical protein